MGNGIILMGMVTYFLIILGMGLYFSRVEMNREKYMLGERKIPGWVLAFSERATGSSAWLLLGFTGFTFATGLSAIWMAVGSALGAIIAWVWLAKKFMIKTKENNALTLPAFIADMFDHNRKMILLTSTIVIVLFFIFYLGAQIAGAGKTLHETFGWNPILTMFICTLVMIILTFWGGFTSVVWTDMVQGILMLLTLTIIPIIALYQVYSQDLSIVDTLAETGQGMNSWTGGLTGIALGVLFFNNFSYFFGYFGGQPQLSTRFMALKNDRERKVGTLTVVFWSTISFTGAFLIGLTGLTLYGSNGVDDVEMILPHMVLDLTPAWLAGILLSGIIAAIITTGDSQLMVVVSSINEDLIRGTFGIKLSDQTLLRYSKITVVVASLLGFVMALATESLVLLIVSWAWGGVGNTFSVVILLAFFWKKYSSIGVLATIISGLVSTIIWISTPLDALITSRFSTFVIALIFGVIFSFIFPDKKPTLNASLK
ncbi:sodium/proline symporter [Pseudogracilibacillus sp. SO10305]|uniref:sodium/proline symporter n=1 Tax=Pseudogracilibacillus sp. SO10305 TaxID=3098292 RepID=UPI00300E0BE9